MSKPCSADACAAGLFIVRLPENTGSMIKNSVLPAHVYWHQKTYSNNMTDLTRGC